MAIGFCDDLRCDLCDEKITGGWELHEVAPGRYLIPDRYLVVCDPCERATDHWIEERGAADTRYVVYTEGEDD